MIYNKLVRDKIPEMIRQQGQEPVVRILEEDEYVRCLHQKLDEEVAEFHRDLNGEELADILEVVLALAANMGISQEKLAEIYREKHIQRGGFADRVFLVSKADKCL